MCIRDRNFGAIKSLITSGIQQGHMKMHLINILNTLNADEFEKKEMIKYFKIHTVTYSSVEKALKNIRNGL